VVRNVKCPSNPPKGDQFTVRNAFLNTGNPGINFFLRYFADIVAEHLKFISGEFLISSTHSEAEK